MALDWDKLRIFHAAAEAGSFTHAANALNLSQSAISRQAFSTGAPVTVAANMVSRRISRGSWWLRPARRYSVWMRCVIGLRKGPSTWPPSWQTSHIIFSSSSTTMKSS